MDRGELYIVTHKKKDGTFINEEARIISVIYLLNAIISELY